MAGGFSGSDDGDKDGRIRTLTDALRDAEARIAHLEKLAHVDELTGALNRRGFVRELERARAYTRRYDVAASLVFIDLDRFKQVNDLFGHASGDVVLCHFARTLQQNLRASDVVGRLGGDEFAAVLMHTAPEAAETVLTALRGYLTTDPVMLGGMVWPIGISAGVTAFDPAASATDLFERADRSLYAAKQGRAAAAAPVRR